MDRRTRAARRARVRLRRQVLSPASRYSVDILCFPFVMFVQSESLRPSLYEYFEAERESGTLELQLQLHFSSAMLS